MLRFLQDGFWRRSYNPIDYIRKMKEVAGYPNTVVEPKDEDSNVSFTVFIIHLNLTEANNFGQSKKARLCGTVNNIRLLAMPRASSC